MKARFIYIIGENAFISIESAREFAENSRLRITGEKSISLLQVLSAKPKNREQTWVYFLKTEYIGE